MYISAFEAFLMMFITHLCDVWSDFIVAGLSERHFERDLQLQHEGAAQKHVGTEARIQTL